MATLITIFIWGCLICGLITAVMTGITFWLQVHQLQLFIVLCIGSSMILLSSFITPLTIKLLKNKIGYPALVGRLVFPTLTIAAIITTFVFELINLFTPWRSPQNIISIAYLGFAAIAMILHIVIAYSMFEKANDTEAYGIDKDDSDKIDSVILRRQYQTNVGHPEYIVTNGQNDSDSGYMANRDADSNLVIHLGDASYRYEPRLSKGPSHGSLSSAHMEDRRSNVSGPMVAHSNSNLNLMSPNSLISDINKNRAVSNNSLRSADSLASSRSSLHSRSNGAVTEAVVVCEYNMAYQPPSEAAASIGKTQQRKSQTGEDVAAKDKSQKQSNTEPYRYSNKLNNQRESVLKNNNTNTEGVRVISNKIQNRQSDTAVNEVIASGEAIRLSRNSINKIGSRNSLADSVDGQLTSGRDIGLQGVRKANSRSSLVDQQRLATSSESLQSTKRRGSRDSNTSRHSVISGKASNNQRGQAIARASVSSPYSQLANVTYQPMMSTPISNSQEDPVGNNNDYHDYSPKKFSEFIHQDDTSESPNKLNHFEMPQPVTVLPSTSKQVESTPLPKDNDKPSTTTEEVNLRRNTDSLKGNIVVASNINVERESNTQSVISNASLNSDMPWLGTLESQCSSIYSNPESATLRSAKDMFKKADRMYNELKKMAKIEESAIIAVIQQYKEIIPVLGDKHKNLRAKAHCRIARIYYNYLKKEEAAGKYARSSLRLAPENCKTEVWYKEAEDIARKAKRKEEWQDNIKKNRLSKLSDTADTKYYFTS